MAIVTDADEKINEEIEQSSNNNVKDNIEEKPNNFTSRKKKLEEVNNEFYGELLNKEAITHPREFEEFNSNIPLEDETEETEENIPAKPEEPFYRNAKGEWVTRVKVNGIEREESIDKILATAQKHESADKRLQDAAKRQKELNELAWELQVKQANMSRPSQQDARPVASDKEIREALDRMYDGDLDFASKRLSELIGQRPNVPTVNEQAIVERAVQEATVRMQQQVAEREFYRSRDEGRDWLQSNYPEILNNPELYEFVDYKTSVLFKQNPQEKPSTIIKQATLDVAKMMGLKQSTRQDKKESLRQEPQKQQSFIHRPKEKKVDNSPEAVLNQIKASRNKIRNSPV